MPISHVAIFDHPTPTDFVSLNNLAIDIRELFDSDFSGLRKYQPCLVSISRIYSMASTSQFQAMFTVPKPVTCRWGKARRDDLMRMIPSSVTKVIIL